MHIATLAI